MNRRKFFLTSAGGTLASAARGQGKEDFQYRDVRWVDEQQDPSLTLETETLLAKIIDNTGLKKNVDSNWQDIPYSHHLGYHGVRALWNKQERRNIVAPFVSWLNLQSLRVQGLELDPVDSRSRFGVGRGWPMRMSGRGEGIKLTVPRMPISGIQYSLLITPAGPDAFDFTVEFTLHHKNGERAEFYASWPCYMSTFTEVQLFFPMGEPEHPVWKGIGEREDFVVGEPVQYTHRQRTFRPDGPPSFPAVYGRIGENVLAIMGSRPEVSFFLVNAGGHRAYFPVQNPAWDFSLSLPDYPVGEPFGFQGRIIYKAWKNSQEITRRYHEWKRNLSVSSEP